MELALASDRLLPLLRRGFYTPWLAGALAGPTFTIVTPKLPVLQTLSIQVFREGEVSEDLKLVTLFKGDEPQGNAIFAYFELTSAAKAQQFKTDLLRGQFLVQVTDRGTPRLGMMRWPVFDAQTSALSYNLTEGQGSTVITQPARVTARALVDGAASERQVLVVERQDDGEWRVAGAGLTATHGEAEVPLEVTVGGICYAVALDEWGTVFEPGLSVFVGQRIRPTLFTGWLYQVTEAGVLPASEPEWWPIEGDNPSRQLGTARVIAVRYYRPQAHGPIPVEMI